MPQIGASGGDRWGGCDCAAGRLMAAAGAPGPWSGAATCRWLRCGPFAPLPQKRRATRSPGTPVSRS